MEEQLILFETAKLAKEKGFNLWCKKVYKIDNDDTCYTHKGTKNGTNKLITAPTQSLLKKWLKEVHNIYIIVDHKTSIGWFYRICGDWSNPFKTYEDALEQGLLEALKLIKQ